jgi:hypothetical protein
MRQVKIMQKWKRIEKPFSFPVYCEFHPDAPVPCQGVSERLTFSVEDFPELIESGNLAVDAVFLSCGNVGITFNENGVKYKGTLNAGLYKDEKGVERYATLGTLTANRFKTLELIKNRLTKAY